MNWYQWAEGWIKWLIGEDKLLEKWKKSFDPVKVKIVPVFNNSIPWRYLMDSFQMTDVDTKNFALQEVDAAGNPTNNHLDSAPSWTTSDSTVLGITPSADGMTCEVKAAGKLGTAQLGVTAVVKGKTLTGSLTINVVPSDAATISIVPV